jgi:putative PIN family toxin of toxin-antitoxin system
MKIFFDTNVYVSEALLGEFASDLIAAVKKAGWRVYASQYLLGECERVVQEKLGFSKRFAVLTRQRIMRRTTLVEPGESRHIVPSNTNDGPILRAALESGVDYLVTNDAHLLALHPYEGLRIVSMKTFRQLMVDEGLLG